MRISQRLGLLALLSALLTGAVGASGFAALSRAQYLATRMAEVHARTSELAGRVRVESLMLRRFEKDLFLNAGSTSEQAAYWTKHQGSVEALRRELTELSRIAETQEDRDSVKVMGDALDAYVLGMDRIYFDIREGRVTTPEAGNKAVGAYKPAIRGIETAGEKIVVRAAQRLTAAEADLAQTTAVLRWVAMIVPAVLAAFGLASSLLIARSIRRPIDAAVGALERVASGDLEVHVTEVGPLELARMARALNVAVANTRAARQEIEQRNQAMRLVLDRVRQGLVTISPSGEMAPERSLALTQWFGEGEGCRTLPELLRSSAPDFAAWLELSLGELREAMLPEDLLIAQLPNRLEAANRSYEVEYEPIRDGGRLTALLVVFSDVTERLLAREAESRQIETVALLERVMSDRSAVVGFLDESKSLFQLLEAADDDTVVKRAVHTLKGNASLLGLAGVARLCHDLEGELAEGSEPPQELLTELSGRLTELRRRVDRLLGGAGRVVVAPEELDAIRREVESGAAPEVVVRSIRRLHDEPVRRPLERLGDAARDLALRMGKPDLVVEIEDHGLRLSAERYRSLWSQLTHVIRNAIDHGIEAPELRVKRGKPAQGHLRLAFTTTNSGFELVVEDDGAGIDWARVGARAAELGLPHRTHAELVEALFADGLTTRDDVTETSGRGVGMAAVRTAVRSLGGVIEVDSRPGHGTCWRFRIPARASIPAAA